MTLKVTPWKKTLNKTINLKRELNELCNLLQNLETVVLDIYRRAVYIFRGTTSSFLYLFGQEIIVAMEGLDFAARRTARGHTADGCAVGEADRHLLLASNHFDEERKRWNSAFHNVTAMVGASVLSLAFATSQLGWQALSLF